MEGWIFLGLIVAVVIFTISIYNRLVTLRNRFLNAFAQIDVQLTRRHDLIPNLVETVKGYMKHERETLENVIRARNNASTSLKKASKDPGSPGAIRDLSGAESALGSALGRLFALREDYPDLKADNTMQRLQEELSTTENRVAFARQAFNDAVMAYNTGREIFPNNMISGMFNFTPAELLEIEDESIREAPQVNFGS